MYTAQLEMDGHLIDSLLLAKVIDRIQLSGLDYHVADLRIGERKQDISHVQLTVWASHKEALEMLVEELSVHGVRLLAEEEIQRMAVEVAGVAPEKAHRRHPPPSQIFVGGQWLNVAGGDWVIVCHEGQAQWREEKTLQVGEQVVLGARGVRACPTS